MSVFGQRGSCGLMNRVGLVTRRLLIRVSGPAGIVGFGSECPALSVYVRV